MTDNRDYIVGASIVLTVAVTLHNSTVPATATGVTLDGLYVGSTLVTVTPNTFTSAGAGSIWTFTIDTTGFTPGIYTWRAKATTASGVALKEDSFVLRAKFGT